MFTPHNLPTKDTYTYFIFRLVYFTHFLTVFKRLSILCWHCHFWQLTGGVRSEQIEQTPKTRMFYQIFILPSTNLIFPSLWSNIYTIRQYAVLHLIHSSHLCPTLQWHCVPPRGQAPHLGTLCSKITTDGTWNFYLPHRLHSHSRRKWPIPGIFYA